jgi:hypothetical protein
MRSCAACLALLIFLPVAIATPSRAAWSGTQADQMISFDDNEYARAVQVVLDAHETLHAFWGEDAPSLRELHYGRSTDHGASWSSTGADRMISFPDGNELYSACAAASNPSEEVVIVVWSEEDQGAREVHYGVSTDGGEAWSCQSSDLILSSPSSTAHSMTPSITCDADGSWHVVWHQEAPGGVAEVHYSRSQDNGATWSGTAGDRVISFPDGQPAIDPQITTDGSNLYVVWREKNEADVPCVHVGVSTDGGYTWSSSAADRVISQPVVLMTDIAIAASPLWAGMGVHVVYRASHNTASPYYYEIYASSSHDQGQSWTGETTQTPVSHDEGAGRSASNPDIFVGGMMGACAVWDEADDITGTKEQHFSMLDWYGWSGGVADSIISFPDDENGYRPSITGTQWVTGVERGRETPVLWVAWTEFAGGTPDNYEVHLSILSTAQGAVSGELSSGAWSVRTVPSPSIGEARFEFALPQAGAIAIEIFGPSGRLVRRLRAGPGSGDHLSVGWDGRDARGRRLESGVYLARVMTPWGTRRLPLVRL